MVQVVGRSCRGEAAHLTIVQHDGTLAKIPAWMTEDGSGEAMVVRDPVVSVAALLEARAILDRSLRLPGGESSPDSGGENDKDQSSSIASVRCHPRTRNDPAGPPTATSEAHGSASERSRARVGEPGRPVSGEGDTR